VAAEVADKIGRRLELVHITGPLRTLSQDIAFGIDQLVERSASTSWWRSPSARCRPRSTIRSRL
jgi:hypothetical protein